MLLVQHEGLVAHTSLLCAAHVLADLDALVQHGLPRHDVLPPADQFAPIAGFGGLCEIALAEHLDVVVGDAFSFFWVIEQVLHGRGEIGKVAFYFDEVLIGAVAAEEVVVMLDPLQFVGHDYRAAELTVLEGARVTASCEMLAFVCELSKRPTYPRHVQ